MRNPTPIAAEKFEALLRSSTTIPEVKTVLGAPRYSGGMIDIAEDKTVIDCPEFNYALVIESGAKREVVFISFCFRGTRLDAVYLRDPKTLDRLKQLFPTANGRSGIDVSGMRE